METEHSAETCIQCDEPIGEEDHMWVVGPCANCGHIHPLGLVHMLVCATDFTTQQSLTNTRRRRAGAKGFN